MCMNILYTHVNSDHMEQARLENRLQYRECYTKHVLYRA